MSESHSFFRVPGKCCTVQWLFSDTKKGLTRLRKSLRINW